MLSLYFQLVLFSTRSATAYFAKFHCNKIIENGETNEQVLSSYFSNETAKAHFKIFEAECTKVHMIHKSRKTTAMKMG